MKKNGERKEKRQRKKQKKAAAKEVQRLLISEIFPVIAGDEKESCFQLENGTYMDMFQINSKDLASSPEDIVMFDNYTWDIFYKTYAKDIKILSFYFPADTLEQRNYISYKLYNTENPVFKDMLYDKLEEAEFIAKNRKDREYVLMFFASSIDDLREKRAVIYGNLSRPALPLVRRIPYEKKEKILYRLGNSSEVIL